MTFSIHDFLEAKRQKDLDRIKSLSSDFEGQFSRNRGSIELRKAFSTVLETNFQIGSFADSCRLFEQFGDDFNTAISHKNFTHYYRSYFYLRGSSAQSSTLDIYARNDQEHLLLHCLSSHLSGEFDRRDNLAESLIEQTEDEEDFIALIIAAGFYGYSIPERLLELIMNRLTPSDRPPRYGLYQDRGRPTQKYLFVSGTARSGTTALGNLLNTADNIALFQELYNAFLGYAPRMFDTESFQANSFTRSYHADHGKAMAKKIELGAMYRGDKRPLFLGSWNITKRNFDPDRVRIVHIVRSPSAVIASYEKRRQRGAALRDAWAPDRGQRIAELDLSSQIDVLEQISNGPFEQSVKIVPYKKALTDLDYLQEIFDFLDLKIDKQTRDALQAGAEENARYIEQHVPKIEEFSNPPQHLDSSKQSWYERVLGRTKGQTR